MDGSSGNGQLVEKDASVFSLLRAEQCYPERTEHPRKLSIEFGNAQDYEPTPDP